MPVTAVEALADALMMVGEWSPESRLYQLRNPLGVRGARYSGLVEPDGTCVFQSLTHGYTAGVQWLIDEALGHGTERLDRRTRLTQLVRHMSFNTATRDDANYALYLAQWLTAALGRRVDITGRLGEIMPAVFLPPHYSGEQ